MQERVEKIRTELEAGEKPKLSLLKPVQITDEERKSAAKIKRNGALVRAKRSIEQAIQHLQQSQLEPAQQFLDGYWDGPKYKKYPLNNEGWISLNEDWAHEHTQEALAALVVADEYMTEIQ